MYKNSKLMLLSECFSLCSNRSYLVLNVRVEYLIFVLLAGIKVYSVGSGFIIFIKVHDYLSRGQSWRRGTKCDCKTDWLWIRSPLEEMKYLLKFIFPFLGSGVEVKRGVEFCHSTRNASRFRQKVGNGVS